MRFEKWQALGNDYLIVEADELPWELSVARIEWLCDPHFGIGADGILLALAKRRPGLRRGPADLQPRRLRGGAVRQWGAGGDPLPASPRLDRRGHLRDPHCGRPDRPDDRLRADLRGRDGQSRDRLQGLPLGRGGREGDAHGRWSRVGLPARLDRQSAVRDRGRRGAGGPRPRRDRSGDRIPRAVSQPHQRLLRRDRRQPGAGADLRAWGGGDALLGHRRKRRRGDRLSCAVLPARSSSSSTAASWRSRSPPTSTCA